MLSRLVRSCIGLSFLFVSCVVLCCVVLSCLAVPCLELSCLVLSCPVLSCPVLCFLVLSFGGLSCLVFTYFVLYCLFVVAFLLSRLLFGPFSFCTASKLLPPTSSITDAGAVFGGHLNRGRRSERNTSYGGLEVVRFHVLCVWWMLLVDGRR